MKTYIQKDDEKILKACIKTNQPALLEGETGIGKTTIINHLAKKKKKTLHRISVNGATSIEEILGKFIPKGKNIEWVDGLLVKAMKDGDWVVFDEINVAVPDILFCLQSLLDDDRKITLLEKENEVVKPHKDFRFFATMNPPEEYIGTKDLNKALKSRFYILKIKHLEPKKEIKLLESLKVEADTAVELVSLGENLRELKDKDEIEYYCSTRDLIQAGQLVAEGIDFKTAVTYTLLHKMDSEDIKIIEEKKLINNFKRINVNEVEELKKEKEQLKKDIEDYSRNYIKAEKELDKKELEIKELNLGIKNHGNKIVELEEELKNKGKGEDKDLVQVLEETINERDELIKEINNLKNKNE